MREKNTDSRPLGRLDTDRDEDGQGPDQRLPLAEERLVLSKRNVEKVAAHIELRTQTENVTVSEPLRTERVEVERVPVDRIVATAPETRVEGEMTIIPVVEEVLVVQYRILEEIRIIRHDERVEHAETMALRRQEAVIVDEDGDELPGGSQSRDERR